MSGPDRAERVGDLGQPPRFPVGHGVRQASSRDAPGFAAIPRSACAGVRGSGIHPGVHGDPFIRKMPADLHCKTITPRLARHGYRTHDGRGRAGRSGDCARRAWLQGASADVAGRPPRGAHIPHQRMVFDRGAGALAMPARARLRRIAGSGPTCPRTGGRRRSRRAARFRIRAPVGLRAVGLRSLRGVEPAREHGEPWRRGGTPGRVRPTGGPSGRLRLALGHPQEPEQQELGRERSGARAARVPEGPARHVSLQPVVPRSP